MAYGENMVKLSPLGSGLVTELLLTDCPAPKTLLDAGCGRGERLADLLQALPDVHGCGVDSDAENAAAARERCPGAEIAEGDVCAVPWPDGYFDAALCECTLSLLPEPLRCLRELHRVLRPGGILLLSDVCTGEEAPQRELLPAGGAVYALSSRGWMENAAAAAGFRLLRERDCREEYLTMAAELIFSGGCACIGAETVYALRSRRAGYRLWILERGAVG